MRTASLFALSVLLAASGCRACRSETSDEPHAAVEPSAETPPPAPTEIRPRPKPIAAPADVGVPPADAEKTKSGLAFKILAPGTGTVHPARIDTVTVQQTGWTKSGEMIDSSVGRGAPITFRVDRTIRGWSEVLQLMVVGEKRRVWVPAALAYGEAPPGAPSLAQGGTPWGDLVFDIELVSLEPAPTPPDAAAAKPTSSSAKQKKTAP